MSETETFTYPIFITESGDGFIFPGVRRSNISDEDYSFGYAWGLAFRIGCNLSEEKFIVTREPNSDLLFPHVVMDIGHPNFAHGGETVYLISGPTFEEIKNNG